MPQAVVGKSQRGGAVSELQRPSLATSKPIDRPRVFALGLALVCVSSSFVDQSVSNTTVPDPRIDRSRIKMTMEKVDGQWRASKVELA